MYWGVLEYWCVWLGFILLLVYGMDVDMIDILLDCFVVYLFLLFYNVELFECGVGVCFKGVECYDVDEYCVFEGWICVVLGKKVDCKGVVLMLKLIGLVEVWFCDVGVDVGISVFDEF